MMLAVLGAAFLGPLLLGVPIAIVLGLAPALALAWRGDAFLTLLAQRVFSGLDSTVLMAVPLFILAGNLMAAGGMTERLASFCRLAAGGVRGGLAYVTIFVSMIFAGITGSAVADASAVGSVLIPAMKREGYETDFAAALVATASTMGPVIPPSIPFIVFGVLGEVSIASLFLAGLIPGALIACSQVLVVAARGRRNPAPGGRPPRGRVLKTVLDAALVLVMPIGILGGILGGVFTATESACMAVVYALFLGCLLYRDLPWRGLPRIVIESGVTSALVMLVIACASVFSWLLAAEEIPQRLAGAALALTRSPWLILLLVNAALLVVGCFLETTASLVILTPVLLPLMAKIGVDPLHFGVIMVVNLVIGLTTPPVGVCLFIACAIAGTTIERITRAIAPFVAASVGVLLLCTYWSDLVLFIPRLFGYQGK